MNRTPWQVLLSRALTTGDASTPFGPQSRVVRASFAVLAEIPWLKHVGEPLGGGELVRQVQGWDQALEIFKDIENVHYGPNGHLIKPVQVVWNRLVGDVRAWWDAAQSEAVDWAGYGGCLPNWMLERDMPGQCRTFEEAVSEYLYEFVKFLMAELIVGDSVSCTYFRSQLEWFHAGHLPCGWEGKWPTGRMRVY